MSVSARESILNGPAYWKRVYYRENIAARFQQEDAKAPPCAHRSPCASGRAARWEGGGGRCLRRATHGRGRGGAAGGRLECPSLVPAPPMTPKPDTSQFHRCHSHTVTAVTSTPIGPHAVAARARLWSRHRPSRGAPPIDNGHGIRLRDVQALATPATVSHGRLGCAILRGFFGMSRREL